ncbi:unnamed protein product [Effrenium voratum]|uniref:Uncharacterized protein n=1 Tax=Effrenium voratum TaxID=2562239 RepID=A0AA36I4M0_9DINO|nr:unnamed protein product [Effrenium voratum]CAJ1380231.1 unnamed protein product [Effrenium voratum]CAJ1413759.1 unnamed protein product [Effrenium voratum]
MLQRISDGYLLQVDVFYEGQTFPKPVPTPAGLNHRQRSICRGSCRSHTGGGTSQGPHATISGRLLPGAAQQQCAMTKVGQVFVETLVDVSCLTSEAFKLIYKAF